MNPEPVVLINAFEVPADQDAAFIAGWERAQQFLSSQEGYLSTKLHRSIAPDADFRFVNVAQWRSPQGFQAATGQPAFRALSLPFRFHASLYQVARQDQS